MGGNGGDKLTRRAREANTKDLCKKGERFISYLQKNKSYK